MNRLTNKLVEALYVIVSIFAIGLAFPSLVSAFIALTTEATFSDCVFTAPFWLITVLGWISAGVYINDQYEH